MSPVVFRVHVVSIMADSSKIAGLSLIRMAATIGGGGVFEAEHIVVNGVAAGSVDVDW